MLNRGLFQEPSDLCLRYLYMFLLWDTVHRLVNQILNIYLVVLFSTVLQHILTYIMYLYMKRIETKVWVLLNVHVCLMCIFNEFMHDWWYWCVCICMIVLCLRGGCMFCVAFPAWVFLTYYRVSLFWTFLLKLPVVEYYYWPFQGGTPIFTFSSCMP